jgi:hypothetical protein
MFNQDRWGLIYLLTAIGLTPGGSSTVHIYTQTVQQQYSTHLHTNNTQNDKKKTKKQTIHRTTQKCNWNSAGRAPSWRVIPWHLPYS